MEVEPFPVSYIGKQKVLGAQSAVFFNCPSQARYLGCSYISPFEIAPRNTLQPLTAADASGSEGNLPWARVTLGFIADDHYLATSVQLPHLSKPQSAFWAHALNGGPV